MRSLSIDQIEAGQQLGRTIFTSNGNVLLSRGVVLTVYMINTLRRIGVSIAYIQDANYEDIEIHDVVSEETKRIVIRQISDTYESIKSGKEFSSKTVGVTIDSLLREVLENKEVLLQLSDIRTDDNASYVHALNVCTMSILIGTNMSLNMIQLKELAIGALFHDIGKVGVREEDPDGMRDLKKHHSWRGFEILKNKREYSLMIAHAAFQHHEAVDGTGIPRGLEADKIHIYAKIIAVANTYDNLLSEFTKGRRILPHEAAEQMMTFVETLLDRDIVVQFLKTVSIYPTGTSVKLSNRESGVVVGQHRGLPSRPIVRIVKRDENNGDLEIKEIDLAKHTTIFIETVLNE